MRRILITGAVKEMANDFLAELKRKNKACKKLRKLIDELQTKEGFKDHIAYLQDIIENYDAVVTAIPPDFECGLKHCLTSEQYNQEVPKAGKENGKASAKGRGNGKKFYELVSERMGYANVRNKVFPLYVERLGIKSCVYCNAQYGISLRKINKAYTSTYEIDHFRPQSAFPHLCTSFFNLQPSCSHCNKTKSDIEGRFNLYTVNVEDMDPFSFYITPDSFCAYWLSRDPDSLRIDFRCGDKELRENHEKRFRVSQKYERHKDEAAELIIKSQIYNKAYLDQLQASFGQVLPQFCHMFHDVILGFPTDPRAIHKRPLTKMKQDVARQLGLLEK